VGQTVIEDQQNQEGLMKIVKLCREGTCCPAVKVFDDRVEIGEDQNTCVLSADEFEILKEKILSKEI
jgi:hypothetical protein